ncbi:MAG: hypothetical protein J6C37_10995 [Roseburia sp.]|nr:hypothetical protein [Roseburia sp.]
MELKCLASFDLGVVPHMLRSSNVTLKDREAILFLYSAGIAVDPGEELFQFKGIQPVHMALFELDGRKIWDKQLPDGVLPGPWFVPVVAFDMDEDGQDEIYFVNNTGAPFSFLHRKLERLDALTGETTCVWKWPDTTFHERMSLSYRFYIVAGYAHGKPVLVTAQGTYSNMYLQGWNNDMEKRWAIEIPASAPGPRASHVTPVIDINEDGVDELFWGERLLSLDDGHEVINYAPDFNGHSDGIIPYQDYETGKWYVFTCREDEGPKDQKRVYSFKSNGEVAWAQIDYGHMHDAWGANVLDGHKKIFMTMRNRFVPDDSGFNHVEDGIFYFDALTGEPVDFKLPCRGTDVIPLDLDGDGYHEFLVTAGAMAGSILNRFGEVIATLPTGELYNVRMGKILSVPGEQMMLIAKESTKVEIYGDTEACDGAIMQKRYATGYLTFMQKLMASGYNSFGSHVACGV